MKNLKDDSPTDSLSTRAIFLTCAVMLGAALGIALLTHEDPNGDANASAEPPAVHSKLTAAQLSELVQAPDPAPSASKAPKSPAPAAATPPPAPPEPDFPDSPEDGNGS